MLHWDGNWNQLRLHRTICCWNSHPARAANRCEDEVAADLRLLAIERCGTRLRCSHPQERSALLPAVLLTQSRELCSVFRSLPRRTLHGGLPRGLHRGGTTASDHGRLPAWKQAEAHVAGGWGEAGGEQRKEEAHLRGLAVLKSSKCRGIFLIALLEGGGSR